MARQANEDKIMTLNQAVVFVESRMQAVRDGIIPLTVALDEIGQVIEDADDAVTESYLFDMSQGG